MKTIFEKAARLAKEKGFDEYCDSFWGIYAGYNGCHRIDNCNHSNNSEQFSAPFQTELQDWLREKHQIEVFVKPFFIPQINKEGYFKYYGMYVTKNCVGDCDKATECKDKYEDAFEEALILALNSIK
jgi:hypothetical protein